VLEPGELLTRAIKVATKPETLAEFRPEDRRSIDEVAQALKAGANWTPPGTSSGTVAQLSRARPVSATVLAQQARQSLAPSSTLTPAHIEIALRDQGLDWVQPFAPGRPLTPYYGYDRRPRERNYEVGRNITTQTRPGRIPYETLKHLIESYDVAMICMRHAIQDLRSMRVRFEAMDGYEENPVKEIAAAKDFWRRPDRKIDIETGKPIPNTGMTLRNWLCKHATDVWRFDCGSMYRHRDRAGRLLSLPIPDGTLFAPMLDYFGTNPSGDAPAFQQFIQGIPWDWIRWDALIYEPMWPHTEDPYGVAPIETILVNANTDIRLQTYFLQFFTTGTVPEAFAIAPEDQSDPDSLADWQEMYNDWSYGDQSERWGLRWLPHDTELEFYKPQQFDPEVAEYVMRRTVAAFMMVPHDLGFTADVNRSTADTQMDTQFRINSLPHVAYYEDIMDAVTQEDLGLPVQIRFDTGREKEDRLMEAQAHQIYVSIGAESADEVRDKVLGHAINPEEKVPRFFDSVRLGPIPIAYLLATAGDVDPLTGAPRPGTVQARDLVLPGTPGPDPVADPPSSNYPNAAGHDQQRERQGVIGPPKAAGPLVPGPLSPEASRGRTNGARPAPRTGANPPRPRGGAGPDQGTAARRTLKEATAGVSLATGIAGSPGLIPTEVPDEDEITEDVLRWRRQSRKRVAKGKPPRPFENSAIPNALHFEVWKSLQEARTREAVDEAFFSAFQPYQPYEETETRPFSGLALRAKDTGRVLMVQRAPDLSDPAGGYFEFPGGHVDEGESTYDGSLREWEEETGCKMPPGACRVSGWESSNGIYRGHIWETPAESDVDLWDRTEVENPDNPDQDEDQFEAIVWMNPGHISNNPVVRPELRLDSQLVQDALKKEAAPNLAGLALVAADTDRVLMVQRGNKDDGGGARFEFPMGHLDGGESARSAARREWQEETGATLPKDAEEIGTWSHEDFQGFVYRIPKQDSVKLGNADGDEISAISWRDIDDLDEKEVRDKVRDHLDQSEPLLEQAEKDGGPPKV
jgi:8-oxo-dGTP pyrophosphatase MutT (NUDIX family)